MQHPRPAAATRKGSALLPAFALTLVLTATTPGVGSGGGGRGEGANLQGLVREFNSICSDLQKARCDLQMRLVDETEFGDQILELFVRADSITTLLEKRAPSPRPPGPAFALQWALKHLRESLRENYEGIVEGDGYRFVTADLALKAAEAWKGSLVERPARLP
jgi:hypothetical protein